MKRRWNGVGGDSGSSGGSDIHAGGGLGGGRV